MLENVPGPWWLDSVTWFLVSAAHLYRRPISPHFNWVFMGFRYWDLIKMLEHASGTWLSYQEFPWGPLGHETNSMLCHCQVMFSLYLAYCLKRNQQIIYTAKCMIIDLHKIFIWNYVPSSSQQSNLWIRQSFWQECRRVLEFPYRMLPFQNSQAQIEVDYRFYECIYLTCAP